MRSLPEIIADALIILIELALYGGGKTINHGDFLDQLGINWRDRPVGQVVARYLDLVTAYCTGAGLLPLTVLVVGGPRSGNSGQPGAGFYVWFSDVDAARRAVEFYDWENSPPPFPRLSWEVRGEFVLPSNEGVPR